MAKLEQILSLLLIVSLMVIGIVRAATEPSAPTSIDVERNTTSLYPNGTNLSFGSRGYIYEINVTESAASDKWVGYVGHVNGKYAVQDETGDALYDWAIITTTGELYATAEAACGSAQDENANRYCGGMPTWTGMVCANDSMITEENTRYNHTAGDEDSYINTFKSDSTFYNPGFYAGTKHVQDGTSATGGQTCFGAMLNYNNTDGSPTGPVDGNWTEIVLTDASFQAHDETGDGGVKIYDITYATILKNESDGFDSFTYDFQILLPQSGLPGEPARVVFYFYVELI